MSFEELKKFIRKAYEVGLTPDQATPLFEMVEPDSPILIRAIVAVFKKEGKKDG